jgi:hypothetical protein
LAIVSTASEALQRMAEERRRREDLPKPIALAVDFVSAMCTTQPPSEVVRLLRRYEDRVREAEASLDQAVPRGETPGTVSWSRTTGIDPLDLERVESANRALEQAHQAARDAERQLQAAIDEAERRERLDQQLRTESQDRSRRDEDERRRDDERRESELRLFAELALSAVAGAELAIQQAREATVAFRDWKLQQVTPPPDLSDFTQKPRLPRLERDD